MRLKLGLLLLDATFIGSGMVAGYLASGGAVLWGIIGGAAVLIYGATNFYEGLVRGSRSAQ